MCIRKDGMHVTFYLQSFAPPNRELYLDKLHGTAP
jgi:hypothetical protein